MDNLEVVPLTPQDIDEDLTNWEKTLIKLTQQRAVLSNEMNILNAQVKEAEVNVKQLTRKYWLLGKV